ncbi:MAG TPA: hypothetical protein VG982_02740 [Candidatus Paceibacterota bacterium]|nr:hypothetical protein [Candidatus Paceibacterota bacterium]
MKNALSDEVDERKVNANLYVIENGHGSFELAEKFASFGDDRDLLKFATESIKKIDPIGKIPLGFTLGFVATYPDVLLWWNSLPDEKQDSVLNDFDENDFLDENQKIKLRYLKIIVETYKKDIGKQLECSPN